jgi:RNA polymerase sigma-70 factor (ECF subfamily)
MTGEQKRIKSTKGANILNQPNVTNIGADGRGAVALVAAAPPLAVEPKVAPITHQAASQTEAFKGQSDEKLFDLATAGEMEALGELVCRYEKPLFALLVRLTNGDQSRADDFFQETFLHALRAAGTFKKRRRFKPWLIQIAVNLVRDGVRKRKLHGEIGLASHEEMAEAGGLAKLMDPGHGPSERAVQRDNEEQIQLALAKLTELEREVVLLHFYENLTLAETAETLSVPVGTAKSRMHSALGKLSAMLRGLEP